MSRQRDRNVRDYENQLRPYYMLLRLDDIAYDSPAVDAQLSRFHDLFEHAARCASSRNGLPIVAIDLLEHASLGQAIPECQALGSYPVVDVTNADAFRNWLFTQTGLARAYDVFVPPSDQWAVWRYKRNVELRRNMLIRRMVHAPTDLSLNDLRVLSDRRWQTYEAIDLQQIMGRNTNLSTRTPALRHAAVEMYVMMSAYADSPMFFSPEASVHAQQQALALFHSFSDDKGRWKPAPLVVNRELLYARQRVLKERLRVLEERLRSGKPADGGIYRSETGIWARLRKVHSHALWMGDFWYLLYGLLCARMEEYNAIVFDVKPFAPISGSYGIPSNVWLVAVQQNLAARKRLLS